MVEATTMIYKVMEEQHKIDSFGCSCAKELTTLKDEMHLNELTCFEVMPHPWHTRA
jgi:hypothetical protein